MIAEELMIGDWVLDGKKPAQITGIMCCDYFETTLSPGVDGECISPIPLTAEILEKNFLTQRGEWTEPVLYFFGDDYIEVSIKEYTEGIWEVVIDEVEMSGLPSWRMYVSDVHQLQHALRLCNIEKEIEI